MNHISACNLIVNGQTVDFHYLTT